MHGHEFSCSLVYLLKFFSGPLKECFEISFDEDSLVIYTFDRFCHLNLFFFFISTFLIFVSFHYSQVLLGFLFSNCSNFFSFDSSIPSVRCCFPLFINCIAHFSMSNSIQMSWLYILTECIRVFNSFSFCQTVWCHPFTLGDWSFPAI